MSAPRFLPVGVFVLAFAIRLLVLIQFSHSPHFVPDGDDMKFYSDWALRIMHGQWTDHKAFYGLPGYAFCLAAIYKVSGGLDPFAAGLLQALMDAGVATLLYLIARTVFAPTAEEKDDRLAAARPLVIGCGAALGWMCFAPAQAFSMILMPTIWAVLAYYLCVWWAVKTQRSSWWRPWFGLGVFAGVIAMLVATILFAVPLLLTAIFLSVERGAPLRARLPKIAAAVLALVGGLCLGAAPAWLHNYFVAREPVMLSAHSGINFWVGNNPTANGYPKMPPGIRSSQEGMLRDSITVAEKEMGRPLTRAEVSRFWSAKANAYIRENRPAWLRLMAVKFGNFWNAFQYDDVGAMKRLRDDGVLPPGLRFGLIAALGLAGMFPAIWLFPRARWIAAAVVLHMGALLPVFVTERYRLAAVPGLMVLAAFGLWQLWANLVRGRWIGAGAYLAITAGAATFVSIPRTEPGLWSLDFYNAGIRCLASGNLALAERHFATAYAYVPDNTEVRFALGNLWLEKSNRILEPKARAIARARAKDFYKRTLELNPRHASTLSNLGVLALEEERWELAEKFFASSSEAEPDDAKTFYLLARARFEAGKTDAAKSALGQALEMRPHQKEFLELRDKLAKPPGAAVPPPAEPTAP
ncbi:MAG: tetratricopeptide repeat protein [Verrucomicrobia bacterium]|nr:MAG: tetratricopeptide repeat protein [Verrucomicrobiota bacterium]